MTKTPVKFKKNQHKLVEVAQTGYLLLYGEQKCISMECQILCLLPFLQKGGDKNVKKFYLVIKSDQMKSSD